MPNKELLSHEQTLEYIKQSKEGDEKATAELVERNYALVKSIAKRFFGRGIEAEDLIQIGCLGLIKAIKNYDSSFNVRFSTYAVPMIAGEIKRFLRDDGMIKVSRSVKEKSAIVFSANDTLKKELGRDPTVEEISSRTGISAEDIAVATEAVKAPLSIYQPAFDEDNSKTLIMDTVVGDMGEMIDRIAIKEILSRLEPQERKLIFLRFFKDKTQTEIAEIIGISQVQVSRLITKTLKKIKSFSE
ncbi:MAG: SigB/SigF/SigG family RNA polymerase sigma factor [Eubacteriales bacterium]